VGTMMSDFCDFGVWKFYRKSCRKSAQSCLYCKKKNVANDLIENEVVCKVTTFPT